MTAKSMRISILFSLLTSASNYLVFRWLAAHPLNPRSSDLAQLVSLTISLSFLPVLAGAFRKKEQEAFIFDPITIAIFAICWLVISAVKQSISISTLTETTILLLTLGAREVFRYYSVYRQLKKARLALVAGLSLPLYFAIFRFNQGSIEIQCLLLLAFPMFLNIAYPGGASIKVSRDYSTKDINRSLAIIFAEIPGFIGGILVFTAPQFFMKPNDFLAYRSEIALLSLASPIGAITSIIIKRLMSSQSIREGPYIEPLRIARQSITLHKTGTANKILTSFVFIGFATLSTYLFPLLTCTGTACASAALHSALRIKAPGKTFSLIAWLGPSSLAAMATLSLIAGKNRIEAEEYFRLVSASSYIHILAAFVAFHGQNLKVLNSSNKIEYHR